MNKIYILFELKKRYKYSRHTFFSKLKLPVEEQSFKRKYLTYCFFSSIVNRISFKLKQRDRFKIGKTSKCKSFITDINCSQQV